LLQCTTIKASVRFKTNETYVRIMTVLAGSRNKFKRDFTAELK